MKKFYLIFLVAFLILATLGETCNNTGAGTPVTFKVPGHGERITEDKTFSITICCPHLATKTFSVDAEIGDYREDVARELADEINQGSSDHFLASNDGAEISVMNKCADGRCITPSGILDPPDTLEFSWDKNIQNIGDYYTTTNINAKSLASGLSYDSINAGKIAVGTSFFMASVNTVPGETPFQILDTLRNQLILNGYQDVGVYTINGIDYVLTFKIDLARDSTGLAVFDDTGVELSVDINTDGCGCSAIDSCVITGPGLLCINEIGLYREDSLSNGIWDLRNYESTAAFIVSADDHTATVNAGPNFGRFRLFYWVQDPIDSTYSIKCEKWVYVDCASPVEMGSFDTKVIDNNVMLSWSTISELNNSGFEIERKSLNSEFTKIGFVNGNNSTSVNSYYNFEDKQLSTGKYNYRLKQIDFNGNFSYYDLQNEVVIGIPEYYKLSQNYPNPFNPFTKITFEIPSGNTVTLKVFDISGREIKTLINEFKEAGYYNVEFNGNDLASGIYYYRLEAGNFISTKKMVLLK